MPKCKNVAIHWVDKYFNEWLRFTSGVASVCSPLSTIYLKSLQREREKKKRTSKVSNRPTRQLRPRDRLKDASSSVEFRALRDPLAIFHPSSTPRFVNPISVWWYFRQYFDGLHAMGENIAYREMRCKELFALCQWQSISRKTRLVARGKKEQGQYKGRHEKGRRREGWGRGEVRKWGRKKETRVRHEFAFFSMSVCLSVSLSLGVCGNSQSLSCMNVCFALEAITV